MLEFKKPIELRDYQIKAVSDLWVWLDYNKTGKVCEVLPTGSGKSIIIAEICKQALQKNPNARILMLTHTKEIVNQNANKLRDIWANAPLGVYSAGLGHKDIDVITFAGIQSIKNKIDFLGKIDYVLIDEAHMISHKDTGTYRTFLDQLEFTNPKIRIIGFTATPYRMGHGLITDDPAIFSDLIEPVSIEELQYKGYLAKLKSKVTNLRLNTDGVRKSGGEFVKKELQAHIDTSDNNSAIVKEIIEKAGDRKHWCIFCTGVEHAEHMAELFNSYGVSAIAVYGNLKTKERDKRIKDFMSGKYKVITNINILSVGFNFPDIDLIGLCRPTCSAALYTQQAGRGLRLKSHTDHCLVLDFAGVVEMHGPITNVALPKQAGGGGTAPAKECPKCGEIIHASLMTCPECDYEFPPTPKEDMYLHSDDIQGDGSKELEVNSWVWSVHTSVKSGKQMLKVIYIPEDLRQKPIQEYLCVLHEGYAGMKAISELKIVAMKSNVDLQKAPDIATLANVLNNGVSPTSVLYKKRGKYYDVISHVWDYTIKRESNIIRGIYEL